MRDARGTFHDARVFALLNFFQRFLCPGLCSLGLKVVLGECEGFTKMRKVTDDESLFGLGVARDKVAALNLPFELFPRRSLKASLASKPLQEIRNSFFSTLYWASQLEHGQIFVNICFVGLTIISYPFPCNFHEEKKLLAFREQQGKLSPMSMSQSSKSFHMSIHLATAYLLFSN